MIEKIYLVLVIVFFILAFAIRNTKTYLSTGKSIRGKSFKLTLSILLSTIIYLLILLRLTILKSRWILELEFFSHYHLKMLGYILVTSGFILGIFALIALKDSWRVGIKYDQKTDLITTGIYRISRNPYFFSYDILILGYILFFPSIILIVLYVALIITFHKMILEEEKYLETVHGDSYLQYKVRVSRYLSFK